MPSRFSPGVLPEEERRYLGREIANAIRAFEDSQDRQRAREFTARERERANVTGDLRVEDELRDRGYRAGGPGPQAGAATSPRNRQAPPPPAQERDIFEGRMPAERPPREGGDVMRGASAAGGQGLRFQRGPDPGGSPSEEFDRFREAGPEGMDRAVVVPGQFIPGQGFSPSAIYEAERERPRAQPQTPPGRRPVEYGDQEYTYDPEFSPEARARRAFEQEVGRLTEAGIPSNVAPVAAEDPALARELLTRQDEDPGITFSVDELISAGIPEEQASMAAQDPVLARDLLLEIERRKTRRTVPGGRGGVGGGRTPPDPRDLDIQTALEEIDNLYGIWQDGELVGHQLTQPERVRLAERWVAGEIRPDEFPVPEPEEPEGPAPAAEEEGPGFGERVRGAFRSIMGAMGASPRERAGEPGASLRDEVDEGLAVVRDFPEVDDDTLRELLQEEQYSDRAIRLILERRR